MYSQSRLLSLLLLCLGSASLAAEPARDRFDDPLPAGAVGRLGSMRLRHEHVLLTATFSADGKTLAACDGNGLSFWDVSTGKQVRRLAMPNPAGGVRLRRFSADGKILIQSGYDNVLRFIDSATGAERHTLNHAACGSLQALDVSRDGATLAAIHQASIALWSVADGKLLHEFKGPQIVPLSPYGLVALTADGKQLVLPHADGSLHLVDCASGKEVRAFEMPPVRPGLPPSLRVPRLALSADGRYLAYGGPATPLTICETATGKRLRELAPPPGILSGLAFTPNGRFLAVDDFTGIRLFGVLSGKELRKLPLPPGTSNSTVFSPDGRTLAAFGGGHTIVLWDVADDRQPHRSIGHSALVATLVFFPDGKRLVSTDGGGGMIVWDLASGRDLAHQRNGSPLAFPVVDEDGESLRFLSPTIVMSWDPRTGRQTAQTSLAGQAMNAQALSPDGRSVVSMAFQPTRQLHLCNLQDGKMTRLPGFPEQGWASQIVFAPDSRRLAAACTDGGLRLWDRETGRLLREWKTDTPARQVMHPAFAGDGRSLALFDGMVRIREIAGGGARLQIAATGSLFALAYSPDGRFLACGQFDGSILVYGTATGKPLAHWQGKQGIIRALTFSRDSRVLASGGANGTILLWELPNGEALPPTLKAEEALAFWQTLPETDAAAANRALAGLVAAPAQAVPLIKERFQTIWKKPDRERLAKLVANLDDDAFKVREHATRELAEAGPDAADVLGKALANMPSTEAKRRIEGLLNRLNKGGSPEYLRSLRAIEVLERIGTPAAKDVLRELARKPLSAALVEEIQASLRRLDSNRSDKKSVRRADLPGTIK